MKKTLIGACIVGLAAGLFATEVSAQPGYDRPPPGWRYKQPYNWCREKARRLYDFEWRMQQDGRISRDEARIAAGLRSDLAASCGGGRWHPKRGWYNR